MAESNNRIANEFDGTSEEKEQATIESSDDEGLLTKVQMLTQRFNELSKSTGSPIPLKQKTVKHRKRGDLARSSNSQIDKRSSIDRESEEETESNQKEKDHNEAYNCYKSNKGLVVLIVNETFTRDSSRRTAKRDIRIFKKIFEELLHFNIITLADRNTDDLKQDLRDISQRIEADVDCFICLISSHGGEQYNSDNNIRQHITLTHNEYIYTHDVIKAFSDCKVLKHKPKVFFIQACSGVEGAPIENMFDNGINVEVEKQSSLMPLNSSEPIETTDNPDTQRKGFCIIPCFPDCLIMFSSASGRVAFSRPGTGGWLPACLCEVMERLVDTGFNTDLLEVLTEVNREMAYTKETRKGYKSAACIYHMLSRDLFLAPKKDLHHVN